MWSFENIHRQEIDILKNLVTMPPVLKFFDSKLPAKISCNTSLKGLGAVLEQKHNRVPSPLPILLFFFWRPPPSKPMPFPWSTPSLKNEASSQLKNTSPHWKVKSPSRKLFLEQNPENWKIGKLINTCVSLIKQHWKKMTEIPQKYDFLNWSIQNFVRKVKQFVRKFITWLIDFANKIYEVEKFLISFYTMLY